MSKVVVIGLTGETGLYVVDIEAGTVQPLEVAASGALAAANELRKAGGAVVKGVDLAVALKSTQSAFSGVFDG